MTPAAWAMLLLLALCWGGSFFFTGIAVKELPTFTIVLARVGFAAIVLWGVMLATGTAVPRTWRFIRSTMMMGALNSLVPFVLIAWGQSHVPSGLAAIFIATTPLFGVVVAHVMTADERMRVSHVAGVLCGFAGVVVLIGPGLLGDFGNDLLAQFALLGASFGYALSSVYARRFSRDGVPPLAAAAGQLTMSAIFLLPLTMLIDAPWTLPVPSLKVCAAVAGLVLFSSALAYILYFRILATAGANNLMLVNFLVPVSATILGVTVLGETLRPEHFAGMALIFAGLILRDVKLPALFRRRA